MDPGREFTGADWILGLVEHEPVAYLSYDYLGLPIEFGLRGGRSERTFGDAVVEAGTLQEFDYTETLGHGEFRLGRGLFALERTLLLHGGIGIAYQLDGERHVEVYFTLAFGTL